MCAAGCCDSPDIALHVHMPWPDKPPLENFKEAGASTAHHMYVCRKAVVDAEE